MPVQIDPDYPHSPAVITGAAVYGYGVIVLEKAIGLYLRTGIQVNRGYTPSAMRARVSQITGKSYKRGLKGLQDAHFDLVGLLEGKTLDQIGAECH